jgi:hypothetical protein
VTGEFPVPATNNPKQVSQHTCMAPLFDFLHLIAAGSVMSVNFGIVRMRFESVPKGENSGED